MAISELDFFQLRYFQWKFMCRFEKIFISIFFKKMYLFRQFDLFLSSVNNTLFCIIFSPCNTYKFYHKLDIVPKKWIKINIVPTHSTIAIEITIIADCSRLNPGAWGEHLTIQLSYLASWLLVKRVCPVNLSDRCSYCPRMW